MGYIDQFVASATFNTAKVIEFRGQSVWKTIVYILVFVIITGAINATLTWEASLELVLEEIYPITATTTEIAAEEEALIFIHAATRYLMIFLDLIAHFILISVIAFAGSKGYQPIAKIAYKEAWNVTAYGISAPILVRLVVQGMGLALPMMNLIYWTAIMIFSMQCMKKIINLEQ